MTGIPTSASASKPKEEGPPSPQLFAIMRNGTSHILFALSMNEHLNFTDSRLIDPATYHMKVMKSFEELC